MYVLHRGFHTGCRRGFCRGFCRGLLRINLEGDVRSMPTLIILFVIFYVIGGDHPL